MCVEGEGVVDSQSCKITSSTTNGMQREPPGNGARLQDASSRKAAVPKGSITSPNSTTNGDQALKYSLWKRFLTQTPAFPVPTVPTLPFARSFHRSSLLPTALFCDLSAEVTQRTHSGIFLLTDVSQMFQGFAAGNHVAMKITIRVLEHYGRYLIICGAVREYLRLGNL